VRLRNDNGPAASSYGADKPGLRKITRNLAPDLATFGWTGQRRIRRSSADRHRK